MATRKGKKRRKPTSDLIRRRRHTAFHEAGHAVARIEFGFAFEYVTIRPSPSRGIAGHVRREVFPGRRVDPGLFEFYDDTAMQSEFAGFTQAELESELMSVLAGEAATYLLTGKRDPEGAGRHEDGPSGDTRDVFDWLFRLFQFGDNPSAPANQAAEGYRDFLWWRTIRLLRRPDVWHKVTAVANALLERQKLTCEEVRRVIEEAGPPPLPAPPRTRGRRARRESRHD